MGQIDFSVINYGPYKGFLLHDSIKTTVNIFIERSEEWYSSGNDF